MKNNLILVAMMLVLASCSTYDYYAVSNKPVSTSKYKTYAWIPETVNSKPNSYSNDIVTDKIVDAASAELNNRGFVLSNSQPDLLIKHTVVVNDETKTYEEPVYYNPPPRLSPRIGYYRGRAVYYYAYTDPFPVYVGSRARRMDVKEGSLMIDIIERSTSKLIWRGWAEGEITNPQKAVEDIPNVIANIFKKLP